MPRHAPSAAILAPMLIRDASVFFGTLGTGALRISYPGRLLSAAQSRTHEPDLNFKDPGSAAE
jgi:hypothetical protein